MKLKAKFYCDLIMLTSTSSHSYSAIIHFYFFLFKFTLSHQIHDTSPLLIRPSIKLPLQHPSYSFFSPFSIHIFHKIYLDFAWPSQLHMHHGMEWYHFLVSDCKMIWDYFIHSTVWNEMDTRAMCSLPLSHIIFF